MLSDTNIDYPFGVDTLDLINSVKSKTFNYSFTDIIDQLELLYGTKLLFKYTESDIDEVLQTVDNYDAETISRVRKILKYQRNKMSYFFD